MAGPRRDPRAADAAASRTAAAAHPRPRLPDRHRALGDGPVPDREQRGATLMFVQPHGIELLHWWSEVGWILKTIRDYRVSLFVEIGVFHGALARIIMDQCVDNIDFNYVVIEHDRDHVDQKAIDYCRGLHEFNDGEAEFMFCDALAPAAVSEVRSRI